MAKGVTNTQAHCTSTNAPAQPGLYNPDTAHALTPLPHYTPNTPCFTAGGFFMPNSQIRFSGPFSFVPNLPYRGYPERLSTAHTVTI